MAKQFLAEFISAHPQEMGREGRTSDYVSHHFLFISFSRLGQHAFSYLLPGSLQVICSDRDKQEEKKGGFLGLLTSHAVTSVSCFFVLY